MVDFEKDLEFTEYADEMSRIAVEYAAAYSARPFKIFVEIDQGLGGSGARNLA